MAEGYGGRCGHPVGEPVFLIRASYFGCPDLSLQGLPKRYKAYPLFRGFLPELEQFKLGEVFRLGSLETIYSKTESVPFIASSNRISIDRCGMAFTNNDLHRQTGVAPCRRFLGPLDGSKLSERALNQSETFAKALQADVILVRVIENPLAATPEVGPPFEKKVTGETPPWRPLRVNMSETPTSLKFTEQGEEGIAHVVIQCCGYVVDDFQGGRGRGEGDAAAVSGREHRSSGTVQGGFPEIITACRKRRASEGHGFRTC